MRLKGELLLDVFLLLSKLFGRDAEGKWLHLIQRANDQVDLGLTPNPRKKIQLVILRQLRTVSPARKACRLLYILL